MAHLSLSLLPLPFRQAFKFFIKQKKNKQTAYEAAESLAISSSLRDLEATFLPWNLKPEP